MNNKVNALKVHVSLNVGSVQESVEFYKKLFGIEPMKVRQGYAKFDVENPPLNLALNESLSKGKGALSHLGIQVASTADVLKIKKRWEESGLNTEDEMQTNCCYALQDKTWVRDPDGNEWEVFVVLKDNLSETSMCCVDNGSEKLSGEIQESVNIACCEPSPVSIGINRAVEKSCC
ncbi:MAG TPA: ArsI/CadI family heavy metal resistance metalloenzyme [Pyrinomonadaceae bacterium]|nr:ArsI/CadI family heavy metal resistance metalloenzyme [Pyrinomonadaceae bacterium]